MDNNREVSVGEVLNSVVQMLQRNESGLNSTSAQHGGTHGNRMVEAFRAAAQAAQQQQGRDAGQQFEAAAEAMRRTGRGQSVNYYANGLQEAAQHFRGRQGISQDDVLPLLRSLAGGAQRDNPAQPGQGSMLDALLPAVQDFTSARNSGQDERQAALQALGGAVMGARSTSQSPWSGFGSNAQRGQTPRGYIDPGAASATNVIGGIVGALLPSVLGAIMSGGLGGGGQTQQPNYPQQGGQNDPLGGLGGLLGGIGNMLGGSGGGQQSQGPLGGLFGGGQAEGGLGGLFGGNPGGQQQPEKDDPRFV